MPSGWRQPSSCQTGRQSTNSHATTSRQHRSSGSTHLFTCVLRSHFSLFSGIRCHPNSLRDQKRDWSIFWTATAEEACSVKVRKSSKVQKRKSQPLMAQQRIRAGVRRLSQTAVPGSPGKLRGCCKLAFALLSHLAFVSTLRIRVQGRQLFLVAVDANWCSCRATAIRKCSREVLMTARSSSPYSALIPCLLYTSDAADEEDSVDLGGRRIIKKKKRVRATA
eukprot:TRINITY_DN4237_c0_g1_i3.p1 TRINITY_DN4237_c0_g1~~TRINITY_DN4237_c0_g1_i3.p1  ORF type:complete len:222 (+),score=0.08 TRINITY_DN4237_c0_g1_i3:25-690(+)